MTNIFYHKYNDFNNPQKNICGTMNKLRRKNLYNDMKNIIVNIYLTNQNENESFKNKKQDIFNKFNLVSQKIFKEEAFWDFAFIDCFEFENNNFESQIYKPLRVQILDLKKLSQVMYCECINNHNDILGVNKIKVLLDTLEVYHYCNELKKFLDKDILNFKKINDLQDNLYYLKKLLKENEIEELKI